MQKSQGEVKGLRAQIKGRITKSVNKLETLVQEDADRSILKFQIEKIQDMFKEADLCNRELYSLLDENEHNNVSEWLSVIEDQVDTAIEAAQIHLASNKSSSSRAASTRVTPQPAVNEPHKSTDTLSERSLLFKNDNTEQIKSWVEAIPVLPVEKSFSFFTAPPSNNIASTTFQKSVPKLSLTRFDGEPLHWVDWAGMFSAIIDKTAMSQSEKMAHLQQHCVGKAKYAIAGFGYNGDLYYEALRTLERRFGDSRLVISSHLEKLRRFFPIVEPSAISIRALATVLNNLVCTFQQLHFHDDLRAASNVKMAVEKLPRDMMIKWNEYLISNDIRAPTLPVLRDWVELRADAYDLLPQDVRSKKPPFNRNLHANAASVHSEEKCLFCNNLHELSKCLSFINLTDEKKTEFVKEKHLCLNCLQHGHISAACPKPKHCDKPKCLGKGKHHRTLHSAPHMFFKNIRKPKEHVNAVSAHYDSDTARGVTDTSQYFAANVDLPCPQFTSVASFKSKSDILLQYAPVIVHSANGPVTTYAMLDMGSTCSLVLKTFASSLGLEEKPQALVLNGVSDGRSIRSSQHTLKLSGVSTSHAIHTVCPWSVDRLNLPHQRVSFSGKQLEDWKHLEGIHLHDVDSSMVTMLIGSDNFDLIVPREVITGPLNAPRAVRTLLGWVPAGPVPSVMFENAVTTCHAHISEPDQQLFEHVQTWWDTESFGTKFNIDNPLSKEDERALSILEKSTKVVDGRYEVGLLWKTDDTVLPSNRQQAHAILLRQERRLKNDPELETKYKQNFTADLEKGFAKILTEQELQQPTKVEWYLPHHPVVNPNKPGKVRRVYNAAIVNKGHSLNKSLLKGPDLLNSLVGVLMRFREHPFAINGDIEGMFSQVGVPAEDQSVLRFLWRFNSSDPVVVGQFQRHIFGATSSPTCANYALRRTAIDNRKEFPEEQEIVEKKFYMDDLYHSTESEEQTTHHWHRLVALLKRGGFRLTKALSNSREVLKTIPKSELAPAFKTLSLLSDPLPTERALGVRWNAELDCFQFSFTGYDKKLEKVTHRIVLSIVASLYDPLGFIAPFVIRGKMLLQMLWRRSTSWDNELQENEMKLFETWKSEFDALSAVCVPRFYRKTLIKANAVDLHIFGDASEKAISAVGYIRFSFQETASTVSFVFGKTRVAPIKPLSIPRLELQAAVLCTRIMKLIKKDHSYDFGSITFWSDSTTVVQWLRSHTIRHPVFVANRVAEILDVSTVDQWRYVPTASNPADQGTRGLLASDLTENSLWLNGPSFLAGPENEWPPDITLKDDISVVSVAVATIDDSSEFIDISRFSSYSRLLNTTAWCFRFIENIKVVRSARLTKIAVQDVKLLSYEELENAKLYWVKKVQVEYFRDELNDFQQSRPLSHKSKLLSMVPLLENGVLKSAGRISKSASLSVKPIILHKNHRFTYLLLLSFHFKFGHTGIEHLKSLVQEQFWISGCRSLLRKISYHCLVCKLTSVKPVPPEMCALPYSRVNPSPPFTNVGIDFFGPITVREGRKSVKRYGCLFTCFAIRAVHIEVTHSMSADSFIQAFRRFISRRGSPAEVWTDNGRNFVGAERELKDNLQSWNSSYVESFMTQKKVKWHFIPAASPHFGGVWERLVKSVKRALYASLSSLTSVDDEMFLTILAEAEALVNSRPLTPVSSDAKDLQPLTPNHFLIGRANHLLPPAVLDDRDLNRRVRWKRTQVLIDSFWLRWIKEYLPTLRQRPKWHVSQENLKTGDVVVLAEDDLPRGSWLLGRVVKPVLSSDGVVRSVKVRTRFGELHRPVVKLALLESC